MNVRYLAAALLLLSTAGCSDPPDGSTPSATPAAETSPAAPTATEAPGPSPTDSQAPTLPEATATGAAPTPTAAPITDAPERTATPAAPTAPPTEGAATAPPTATPAPTPPPATEPPPTPSATATAQPTCSDGRQNGDEAGVDCGGACPVCLPEAPEAVAPANDPGVATSVGDAVSFLFEGEDAPQTGVADGALDPLRTSVVRGRVLDLRGEGLPRVRVAFHDRPELGETLTREDGGYDLATESAVAVTLDFSRDGYLPAQRQTLAPWQGWVTLEDVVLVGVDPVATVVDLTSDAWTVHEGSVVEDEDGVRQAVLLFPPGNAATMTLPGGETVAMDTLTVRATEYTVGDEGPAAMPADLPANSAYTYCAELSVDEAMAMGAADVAFDVPIPWYLDNFLGFPVGERVPSGFYDRQRGVWVPGESGRVVKVLGNEAGLATLDLDGDGAPEDAAALEAAGITPGEREQLASIYPEPTELWRVAVPHFTPWDSNWGFGPPDDADEPKEKPPRPERPPRGPCNGDGSIIECDSQVLGEVVGLAGTPYHLYYGSDRVPGRLASYTLDIPLTGPTVTPSMKAVDVKVQIAGRVYEQRYSASPNLTHVFQWDGEDAYGRPMQGTQPAAIRVSYVYDGAYSKTNRFGYSGNGALVRGDRMRREISLDQYHEVQLGGWDARSEGLGGFSLSEHHFYDPRTRILHYGNGERRSAEDLDQVITTLVGTGAQGYSGDGGPGTSAKVNTPTGIAVAPDGTMYFSDAPEDVVRKRAPDGTVTLVAGTGAPGYNGDDIPATSAQLNQPWGLEVGPDGSLYIADAENDRIRRVTPDGIIHTVVGVGTQGYSGDGGPAEAAQLNGPRDVALFKDGSLYVADSLNNLIRRVDTAGQINTVAGQFGNTLAGNGRPATSSGLSTPSGIDEMPDGSLLIADTRNNQVRRVTPDGIIETVAGRGYVIFNGDDIPATSANIWEPYDVAVSPDGSYYIACRYDHRIRYVNTAGYMYTTAGDGEGANGFGSYDGDDGPAQDASLKYPRVVALGADGAVYVGDTDNHRFRRVRPALPAASGNDFVLPSDDGSELYTFDAQGRHKTTTRTLTGALLLRFDYDDAGRLVALVDAFGNTTRIERDEDGQPTAIVAPGGQTTGLTLGEDGWVDTVTRPDGSEIRLDLTEGGLLTGLTDPTQGTWAFEYDGRGRLVEDEGPEGSLLTLRRFGAGGEYEIQLDTVLGRGVSLEIEDLPTGGYRRTMTDPAGSETVEEVSADGLLSTVTYADGSARTVTRQPDARWQMESPFTKKVSFAFPSGLTSSLTATRNVVQSDAHDITTVLQSTETVSVGGATATRFYDATLATVTDTSPEGRPTVSVLGDKGEVKEMYAPGLSSMRYTWNADGSLAAIRQGARRQSYGWDDAGNLASITDPADRQTTFDYDEAGRLTHLTLPDEAEVSFAHDDAGRLTALTLPDEEGATFAWDDLGRLLGFKLPTASGAAGPTFTYDDDGALTRLTTATGKRLSFAYDAQGRPSTLTSPGGLTTWSWDDATGALAQVKGPSVTVDLTWDGPLETGIAWSGAVEGEVGFTWNGRLLHAVRSVGETDVTLTWDDDGLLIGAGDLLATRDEDNGLLSTTEVGLVSQAYAYDAYANPTASEVSIDGELAFDQQIVRDDLGRILDLFETEEGIMTARSYEHDERGHLTEVYVDSARAEAYTWDAVGRRTSATVDGETRTATYDGQGRILSFGDLTYAWDDDGLLKSRTEGGQTTAFTHDALGHLTGVTLPDGKKVTYVVDPQGRRVRANVDGVMHHGFLYQDASRPIAQLGGDGQVEAVFVWGTKDEVPDYLVKGDGTYALVADLGGSVRRVIDAATGEVVQALEYDAFGDVLFDSNPGFQPFGFLGGITDPWSGLVTFGGRDYDPVVGRWIQRDPLPFTDGDLDPFGFAFGDPVDFGPGFGDAPAPPSVGAGGVGSRPIIVLGGIDLSLIDIDLGVPWALVLKAILKGGTGLDGRPGQVGGSAGNAGDALEAAIAQLQARQDMMQAQIAAMKARIEDKQETAEQKKNQISAALNAPRYKFKKEPPDGLKDLKDKLGDLGNKADRLKDLLEKCLGGGGGGGGGRGGSR